MALTREIIIKNAELSNLTDAQIQALEALSKNDENTVIAARFSEVYNELDSKIEAATGIKRNGDEKTYIYLERATKGLKDSVSELDGFKTKVSELENEKKRLEKAIQDGATDQHTKDQLTQANADLANVKNLYNELKADYDKLGKDHQSELFGLKVDGDVQRSLSQLKFKSEFPKQLLDVAIQQAVSKVKSMNPVYEKTADGKEILAFKDETGAIIKNPEKQLNPFTADELLAREFKAIGVLDDGRQQGGGGTNPGGSGGSGQGGTAVDISGAKTKVEAVKLIQASLSAKGLISGTEDYETQLETAFKDNNVSALPDN